LLFGQSHPLLELVTEDLIALCEHEDAGDVIMLGWSPLQPPVSFPDESGSHAGPGPLETSAFCLLPEDTLLNRENDRTLRPNDLRNAALHVLDRDQMSNGTALAMPERSSNSLRVMTYNVHSCIGMDSKISPERIARVIARYQPDIVALQELDAERARTQGIHQARLIADLLQMQYHYHPTIHLEDERYGDAILTHLPMTLRKASKLPGHPKRPDCEPRGALWVSITFQDTEVQVFNTHLGLYAAERKTQTDALLGDDWLNHPACIGPIVFCGDLNATPSSYVMNRLSTKLSDVQTRNPQFTPLKTYAGRIPTLRIDHILTAGLDCVERVSVPNNSLTRQASDHLPLFSDMTFATPGNPTKR